MRYTLTVDRGAISKGGPTVRIEEEGLPERCVSEVLIQGPARMGRIAGGRVAVETDGPIVEVL